MKGGIGKLMQQAQAMQERVKSIQKELSSMEVQGTAGAGMVTVTLTGKHDARNVQIDDSLFNANDKDMLEDLITAAINDAVRKIEENTKAHYQGISAGMDLPSDLNLADIDE